MTDKPPSKVLGALPNTRPHRRSEKRATRTADTSGGDSPAAGSKAAGANKPPARSKPARPAREVKSTKPRLSQPDQPQGTPAAKRGRTPAAEGSASVIGTAVQAAAELTEIGLSATARAIRGAVSRLPRP